MRKFLLAFLIMAFLGSVPAYSETNINLSDKPNQNIMYFPAHAKYRAWQGVATDGKYLYLLTDNPENLARRNNIISVYDMKGRFKKDYLDAYTGKDSAGRKMAFGDGEVIDGKLYVTAYNFNDGGPAPYESRMLVYSLYPEVELLEELDIGPNVAEGVGKHLDDFWVCYFDIMKIKRFDAQWNLKATYDLPQPLGADGGYESLLWEGESISLNMHGPNENGKPFTGKLDRFTFDGEGFAFAESIVPPSYGATQGIAAHDGSYYWSDRVENRIIITNTLDVGNLKVLTSDAVSYQRLIKAKLKNNWTDYDTTHDRSIKFWKDESGVVHLEGIAKGDTIGPLNPIFTLPKGYRPKYNRNFAVVAGDNFGRLAILGNNNPNGENNAGNVGLQSGSTEWVSLDGVTFLADPDDN